ncbi:MAG: peptidase G2 autoproteolytic cleavage domain-containing protein, partial [Candidatus Paceibacterota bacterium]
EALHDDKPIGIISKTATILGNASSDEWQGKYLRDKWAQLITQPKIVVKNSQDRIEQVPVINPKFDPSLKYIPRSDRPEWNLVGLLGQIRMRKGQVTHPNWIKMKDMGDDVELWLVK